MSKRKITVTRENNVLYHFTSVYHAIAIVDSGYLKLTESNLVSPDGTWQTELKSKNYKPVVWLTDSKVPEGLGLSSCPMKKRIRITVAKRDTMIFWRAWEPQKHMDKWWRKMLCKGQNPSSWYVSEEIVPFSDFLKIEDMETGVVYYDAQKEAA